MQASRLLKITSLLHKAAAEKIDAGIAKGQTVEVDPSAAQIESENYKKAHVDIDGLKVSIENPFKSTRSGTDGDGKEWSQKMWDDYGYVKGSIGYDSDHVDVFINPGIPHDETIWDAEDVYVVNQVNADGSFDEHKCMLGYVTKTQAKQAYLQNYEDGWQGCGSIVEMSWAIFKEWVMSTEPKKGKCTEAMAKEAKVILDIEKGDTVLVGRFKNKPVVVETIGTDENGQPTINGRKLLSLRIKKLMPAKKKAATAAAASKALKKKALSADARAGLITGGTTLTGAGLGALMAGKGERVSGALTGAAWGLPAGIMASLMVNANSAAKEQTREYDPENETLNEHLLRKAPGSKLSTLEPRAEYKKIYGDNLEPELDKAVDYTKANKLPIDMGSSIRNSGPLAAIIGKNVKPEYGSSMDYKEQAVALRPGGFKVGEFEGDRKSMGFPAAPSDKVGSAAGSKMHELAHAMSVNSHKSEGGLDALVNDTLGERVPGSFMAQGREFAKQYTGKVKAGDTKGAQDMWANAENLGPMYPESDPSEVVPPLSALQQHLYKTTGRRIESPEEYDAMMQPFDDMSDSRFEAELEKLPLEVERLLRYRRNMDAQTMPGIKNKRKELYDKVNRQLIPGVVKQGVSRAIQALLGIKKTAAYDASKEWIAVDLDGTLAKYTEWKGSAHIGNPIPRMVTRVKKWLKEGKQVKILTARASGDNGTARRAIAKWTKEHLGQELPVTCIKDMYCTAIYDDKAKGVTKNQGKVKTRTIKKQATDEETKAPKGKAWTIRWADGRGIAAFRHKEHAQAFYDSGVGHSWFEAVDKTPKLRDTKKGWKVATKPKDYKCSGGDCSKCTTISKTAFDRALQRAEGFPAPTVVVTAPKE